MNLQQALSEIFYRTEDARRATVNARYLCDTHEREVMEAIERDVERIHRASRQLLTRRQWLTKEMINLDMPF